MSGWLVVFAKAPRAGAVKTRMTPPLAPERAAALYACMLQDVLETSARAAAELGLHLIVAADPPERVRALVERAPPGTAAIAQRGPDLGARLERVVVQASAAGALPVLIRGSDSPALRARDLGAAWEALGEHDLVLGPDVDGGYNVVGLRRPAPGLFAHPMSTGHVLRDTLANARRLGLRTATLPESFDLDTAADLALLARARRESPSLPCPRTLGFLDAEDLWGAADLAAARFPGSR